MLFSLITSAKCKSADTSHGRRCGQRTLSYLRQVTERGLTFPGHGWQLPMFFKNAFNPEIPVPQFYPMTNLKAHQNNTYENIC